MARQGPACPHGHAWSVLPWPGMAIKDLRLSSHRMQKPETTGLSQLTSIQRPAQLQQQHEQQRIYPTD